MSADSSSAATGNKLKQRLAECFERGMRLMTADKDHDYAHMMFAECVVHEPANIGYVEAMLRNLQQKYSHRNHKTKLFGRGSSRELRKALDYKEWKNFFRLGIEVLKDDPWDVATLRTVAQACSQLHYNEVELAYLKQALESNPKDLETNKHCARSLARMGQFDQAIACWHRIETLQPGNKEAARMIVRLSEEKLKHPGGRSPATAARVLAETVSTSDASMEEASQGSPEIPLSPRQQLERAVADDPYDVTNYLELADLLCHDSQFSEAEAALSRGIATVGEHSALVHRLQRVRTQRAELETAAAEVRRKAGEKLQIRPNQIPWLELLLGLAATALLFQFLPTIASAIWQLIDIRDWSKLTWFVANILVLLLLCIIRSCPKLFRPKSKRQSKVIVKQAGAGER